MTNILVGIDFTKADDKVLEHAKALAKAFSCRLQLLHLSLPEPEFMGYPDFVYPGLPDTREETLKEEKARLTALVDDLRKESIEAEAYMKEAPTSTGILEFSEEHDSSVIVIGTHSRNMLERALLGQTADRIIRKSHVPVFVIPTNTH